MFLKFVNFSIYLIFHETVDLQFAQRAKKKRKSKKKVQDFFVWFIVRKKKNVRKFCFSCQQFNKCRHKAYSQINKDLFVLPTAFLFILESLRKEIF